VLRQAVIRKHGDISKEDKDLDSVFKVVNYSLPSCGKQDSIFPILNIILQASSVGEGSSNLTTNYIIKVTF
jgi:hypothetical protein